MNAVVIDLTSARRLDDALRRVDASLWLWASFKRRDRAPCDWPEEGPIARAMRQQIEGAAQSTAPKVLPDRFLEVDAAVAKCKPIERRVLVVRYVIHPDNGKDFQRKRLHMSEGVWDRTLRSARITVSRWLT